MRNLPLQLTRLIGRESEVTDVAGRLTDTRLLTVTGPGGVGKTRLAIEAAHRSAAGDVVFVDLSPILDHTLVPSALAGALGAAEVPGESLVETLVSAIGARSILLVLDNCEHLIVACEAVVDQLLRSCPSLTVLTTSREPLNLPGEVVRRVPPLPREESIQLFVERAAAAEPGFRATTANLAAIEQICEQLDGLPLAIELAAPYTRLLSVEQIATRLGERFELLASRGQAGIARHQSLRTLIDWSYELLSSAEQQLFRRLSVFAGGCSMEAIQAVCFGDGETDPEVLALLRALVEKSLVAVEERDGETRYRMLETLRQQSREKLRDTEEERPQRQRHLAWFLGLAQRAEAGLHGAESPRWRRRLELELDNLRVGLTWARIESSERAAGLELATALAGFWWSGGRPLEGREWIQTLLEGVAAGAARVRGLAAFAGLCIRLGEPAGGEAALQEAAPLARRLGDRTLVALVLTNVCQVRLYLGDLDAAEAASDEALAHFRELGGGPGLYYQLVRHCRIMEAQGRPNRALACCEEALALAEAAEDRSYRGVVLCRLGNLLMEAGRLSAARHRLEEAVHVMQEAGQAPSSYPVLHYLAGLAAAEGALVDALTLAGAAVALRKELGGRLLTTEWALLERRLQPAYQAFGPAVADAARKEGAGMSLDDAIAYALHGEAGRTRTAQASAVERSGSLTPREVEVLRLVAAGRSNREIAEILVISARTVVHHIEHIYQKIGARNRAEAATYAMRRGLLEPEAARP